LIEDIKVNLLDRDVEVLIKTLPAFTDKNLLTRPDIMLAFEKCYNDAKETSFFEQANQCPKIIDRSHLEHLAQKDLRRNQL
jgi:hypothetical protein